MYNWENENLSESEKKVMKALSDDDWDFRSIEGISGTTKIAKNEVNKIVTKFDGTLIRSEKSRKHNLIYTISDKQPNTYSKLKSFISKSKS